MLRKLRHVASKARSTIAVAVVIALLGVGTVAVLWPNLLELVVQGENREIPNEGVEQLHAPGAPGAHVDVPKILLIALDGVERSLLYDELESGRLPRLSSLLGGRTPSGAFPHAYFDRTLLSTLPSTTMAAWATTMTGVPPAEHGVTGNEFFIRESLDFAAPAPVTLTDPSPTLRIYTDGYANDLLAAPMVWQRLRERYPSVVIWSSMLPFYDGVDLLLTATRTVMASAFEAFIASATDGRSAPRPLYATLDKEAVDTVVDELEERPVPDVLVVYFPGIDLYAHHAEEGPDAARRGYLRDVIDPELGKLEQALAQRDELGSRWVLVVSDHGHTAVERDDEHALSTDGPGEPPDVLRDAGFRVRPFRLDVGTNADFQSVLAYQGAMAFVYVADRSTCPRPGEACNWSRPPRYEADVLQAAEAFYLANARADRMSALHGTLDLVLTRRPRPVQESDEPFGVYRGNGELQPLEEYTRAHPEPRYVALEARLRDLAAGRHGERAGDVLLLAHNGDRARAAHRYYFSSRYRSWHGSPSQQDSEVPLIVARRDRRTNELERMTRNVLGMLPRQQKVSDLLLQLPP